MVLNGEPVGGPEDRVRDLIWRVHESADEIGWAEYALLVAQAQWDRTWGSGVPDPFQRVDLRTMPTRF